MKQLTQQLKSGHMGLLEAPFPALDDFRTLTVHGEKTSKQRLRTQDKGHVEEVRRFLQAVASGEQTPIPFHEILATTRATLKVKESLTTRMSLTV